MVGSLRCTLADAAFLCGVGVWSDKRIRAIGGRVIPDDPAEIVPAIYARPAKLGVMSDRETLGELVAVYRVVCRQKTGAETYAYAGGCPREKSAAKMLVAARLLRELDVAPSAWCEASFDQFEIMTCGAKHPRPVWVWSESRLARDSSSMLWYREHEATYATSRQVVIPELLQLRRDWDRMWMTLRAARPTTVDDCERVVRRYFPQNSYALRLQKARAAAAMVERETCLKAE